MLLIPILVTSLFLLLALSVISYAKGHETGKREGRSVCSHILTHLTEEERKILVKRLAKLRKEEVEHSSKQVSK